MPAGQTPPGARPSGIAGNSAGGPPVPTSRRIRYLATDVQRDDRRLALVALQNPAYRRASAFSDLASRAYTNGFAAGKSLFHAVPVPDLRFSIFPTEFISSAAIDGKSTSPKSISLTTHPTRGSLQSAQALALGGPQHCARMWFASGLTLTAPRCSASSSRCATAVSRRAASNSPTSARTWGGARLLQRARKSSYDAVSCLRPLPVRGGGQTVLRTQPAGSASAERQY